MGVDAIAAPTDTDTADDTAADETTIISRKRNTKNTKPKIMNPI
jgi:hypothetical protein